MVVTMRRGVVVPHVTDALIRELVKHGKTPLSQNRGSSGSFLCVDRCGNSGGGGGGVMMKSGGEGAREMMAVIVWMVML